MLPPLTVWAHYSPGELSWCPDCRRISNSVQQCHACGATCGLVGVVELMDRQSQEMPIARPETGVGARSSTDAFKYDY
jgi:hypothetical protein